MRRVFGIVGRSGSGKTTLIEAMVAWFKTQNLKVAVIKHSHHYLQFEPPQKDSARFRSAGAQEVIIASPYHYALIHTLEQAAEPTLEQLVAKLSHADVVLVEGYRQAAIPRLEVYRPENGTDPVYPQTEQVVALATPHSLVQHAIPQLDLNQPAQIAQFIWDYLQRSVTH